MESYHIRDFITGGIKQMMVLENDAALSSSWTNATLLDEKGEQLEGKLTGIRYEILVDEGKAEEMRVILRSSDTLRMTQEDEKMLLNAGKILGLDTAEATKLVQLVYQTLEQPMKNKKVQIGEWKYSGKYVAEEYGVSEVTTYLDITLKK